MGFTSTQVAYVHTPSIAQRQACNNLQHVQGKEKYYSGVLLKWEFFIKMRAAYFAPSFLQKKEDWSEDGCKHTSWNVGPMRRVKTIAMPFFRDVLV